MSKAKGVMIGAGVASVAILGAIVAITLLKPYDDVKEIRKAIAESIKASKDGRPGGVLDHVSVDLRINESSIGGARDISDFVRKFKPDVEIPQVDPKVFTDSAQINTPIKLTLGMFGARQSYDLKDVIITMKKEEDRMWLVFPSHTWKVAEVRVPANSFPEAIMGFGG